jgi:dynein light chain roadblock-type
MSHSIMSASTAPDPAHPQVPSPNLVNPSVAQTPNGQSSTNANADPPPELEATLARLSAYRSVRGVMILSRKGGPSVVSDAFAGSSRAGPGVEGARNGGNGMAGGGRRAGGEDAGVGAGGGIVMSTGTVFEGEGGKRYATSLERVVESMSRCVVECEHGVSPFAPLLFLSPVIDQLYRIRRYPRTPSSITGDHPRGDDTGWGMGRAMEVAGRVPD